MGVEISICVLNGQVYSLSASFNPGARQVIGARQAYKCAQLNLTRVDAQDHHKVDDERNNAQREHGFR